MSDRTAGFGQGGLSWETSLRKMFLEEIKVNAGYFSISPANNSKLKSTVFAAACALIPPLGLQTSRNR